MTQMIRKHILLPKPLDERLKLLAAKGNKPEAKLIHELLEDGIAALRRGKQGQVQRPLQINAQGPADLSSRIDDYLYGKAT